MKKFRKIVDLRSETPDLNPVLAHELIIYELGMEHFRIGYFKECIEVLVEMRKAVNTASEMVRKVIKLDQFIIFSHLRLKETNKEAIEWIRIFKEDLVKAYGSVSIVREVAGATLREIEEAGIDFFKI